MVLIAVTMWVVATVLSTEWAVSRCAAWPPPWLRFRCCAAGANREGGQHLVLFLQHVQDSRVQGGGGGGVCGQGGGC